MNVFEAVKQTVTTRRAAENYGIRVNRAGKANCPFHNDRTPSMKVDKRFHCFGCGADGDVIDFTAQLFGLDAKSAAEKLAADFQIPYTHHKRKETVKKTIREKSEEQMYRELEARCFRVLSDYFHLLRHWERAYAPKPEDETGHPDLHSNQHHAFSECSTPCCRQSARPYAFRQRQLVLFSNRF